MKRFIKHINKFLMESVLLQRETYELMFQRGWYPVECAPKEKIGMKYNQFNQEYTDLHTTNQSTAN